VWGWLRRKLGLFDLFATLEHLNRQVAHALTRPPPPPPPAFVCVLIEGKDEHERPLTAGTSGLLSEGSLCLAVQCMVPLHDVRVTVFCDLQRVSVQGIFCGVHYLAACVGECPVAYVAAWLPGVLIRVPCALR
jgi:hypothetical protein